LDFHNCHNHVYKQGLVYSVVDYHYPGNSKMQANTRKTMIKRKMMVENKDGNTSPNNSSAQEKVRNWLHAKSTHNN
jgi:hypothetical protein